MSSNRRTQDIGEEFFNDGHWYTLTSGALGGLSPEDLSGALRDDTGQRIRELMEHSICLPLAFDSDCALDVQTRFVIGDLSKEEEAEWIARVRAPLAIPDGKFVLVAGAMPEDFEAIGSERTGGYVTVDVQPGHYLIEIYAFVGSYTVNEIFFEEEDDEAESYAQAPSTQRLQAWWKQTRGVEPLPGWLEQWAEEGYVEDEPRLLAYVIRLIRSDESIPLPPQDEDYGWWVTEFQSRQPAQCPRGIDFS